MKDLLLSSVFLMVFASAAMAAPEMEAGQGDLAIPDICVNTTGVTVQKTFHPNGSLEVKAACRDGKFNGIVKKYTPEGKIRLKAEFSDGKMNGTVKLHDASGNIVYRDIYENGVRKEHATFDATGALVPVK